MKALITFVISLICVLAHPQTGTNRTATCRIEVKVNGSTSVYTDSLYQKSLAKFLPALDSMKATKKKVSDYTVRVTIDSPKITSVWGPEISILPSKYDGVVSYRINYQQDFFEILLIDNHTGKPVSKQLFGKAPLELAMEYNFTNRLYANDGEPLTQPAELDPQLVFKALVGNNTTRLKNFAFKTKPVELFAMVKPSDLRNVRVGE